MVYSIDSEQANGVASGEVKQYDNGVQNGMTSDVPESIDAPEVPVAKDVTTEVENGTTESVPTEQLKAPEEAVSSEIPSTGEKGVTNGEPKDIDIPDAPAMKEVPSEVKATEPHTNGTTHGLDASEASVPSYLLTGKVALVTGAGRGMGRETALELARRGAKVVVNYANSSESAETVVSEIKSMHKGSEAVAIKANVSKVSEIVELFEKAVEHFGRLDIVVSNSGVVSFGHLKDVTEEEFDRVFTINTKGQFFVAREAYKHLSIGGRIILMGSITGQAKGVPKHTVYSASKGAIETFVRCMAIDCGDKKITVNAVAPGGIKTDMYHAVCKEYIPGGDEMDNDQIDEFAATWSPCRRVGMPIDVARVTCFLASQDGEWVNGKIIGVDGAACM